MPTPSSRLSAAFDAAHAAAAIIMRYYADISLLTISEKGQFDLLTQADVEAEAAIRSVLTSSFPDDGFLGEESGISDGLTAGQWIVDPIDGTTNFSHGFPVFSISIAYYEGGLGKLGLVMAPALNELFWAERGKGAFLSGVPIHVSKTKEAQKSLIGTGFPYRDTGLIDSYMAVLQRLMRETQGVRRPGSAAYDLCCVAAGRYDGFFEYALAPWDVAAGSLIIEEAGGLVSDWNGERNWLHGRRYCAGNTDIHAYLCRILQEEIPQNHRTTNS